MLTYDVMFCINCGKQIDDNSNYCKYCGKKVASTTLFFRNKGVVMQFQGLSKGKQIGSILYGIWVLFWLCFLIANVENCLLLFFLFAIVFPFTGLGLWYIRELVKKKKSPVSRSVNKESKFVHSSSQTMVCSKIVSSESLLDFSRANGKMQVVIEKKSAGIYERYCRFVSEDGRVTRVNFSVRIGFMNSKNISNNKFKLLVNKLDDGTYCLDFI